MLDGGGRVLALLLACAPESAPAADSAPAAPIGPDIAVDAVTIDLGATRVGGALTATLTVRNEGDETLELQPPILQDTTGNFTVAPLTTPYVLAGGAIPVELGYAADLAGSGFARLLLPSDDPDEPLVELVLVARGVSPTLTLDPPSLDFGTIEERCVDTSAVTLRNDGDDTLVVTDLAIQGGESTFALDLAEETNGPLPWSIAPGAAVQVWATFTPSRNIAYAASLVVRSDDPANPTAAATLDGEATANARVTDNFVTFGKPLDIVMAIGGADPDTLAVALVDALPALTAPLLAMNAEFQIAAIRADDGCLVNGLLPDETMTDDERASALTALLAETGTEHTLTLLERALAEASSAGCNEDLVRLRSILVLVGLTDEASPAPQAAGVYSTLFEGVKSDADDSSAWAVAPDGGPCGTQDGAWLDVTTTTGGGYLSVCDGLVANLATLAESQAIRQEQFPLSKIPWTDTLVVYVDGDVTRAWTYDPETNAIVFDEGAKPLIGDAVRVIYDAIPVCGSG